GLIYVTAEDGLFPTLGLAAASLSVNISMTLLPGIVIYGVCSHRIMLDKFSRKT
ncbi:unnamed protein product, partial [marine sediment metagenome]